MKRCLTAAVAAVSLAGCAAPGVPSDQVDRTVPRKTQTLLPEPSETASTLKAPSGVVVSGRRAGVLQVMSFTVRSGQFEQFSPVLRIRNTGDKAVDWVTVTVTALKGESVKAVGVGYIEGLDSGDTTTVQVWSDETVPQDTRFTVEMT